MQNGDLPLADVVSSDRLSQAFEKHDVNFGADEDAVYTTENHREYPQNPVQKEGLGFPILRCITLISLYTVLLFDVACGPYGGKETGEWQRCVNCWTC